MPILPFDSRHGYSVGATAVVDSFRNINAVGGTFSSRVSMSGGLTTSELFVGGGLTVGTVSATTYRNLPVASGSQTGVASFDSNFTVSSAGVVTPRFFINSQFIGPIAFNIFGRNGIQLVQNEDGEGNDVIRIGLVSGITGDTVVAGTNVGVSRSGKTVTISSTHPLASASATGVASFNDVHFTLGNTGHVSLASAYRVTGDTVAAGTNVGISRSGNTVTVSSTHPIATSSVTGVASFNNQFVVSATGAVGLTSNYIISANSLTGAIEVSGSTGILVETIAASKRILVSLRTTNFNNATANITTFDTNTNSLVGVNGFSYDSGSGTLKIGGSVILADPQGNISFGDGTTQSTAARIRLASTTVTGNASFNNVHFSIGSSGHVSLASPYTATGDTIVAGTNVGISRSGNSVTVSSTHPIASASATGVASFNSSDFVVSATGAVSLTDVFTGGVTCTAAVSVGGSLTAQSLFVSQGVTLNSRASLVGGATAAHLFVGAGTTLNSSLYVGGNSTLGATTSNTITLPSGQIIKTYFAQGSTTTTYSLFTESQVIYSSADILIQAEKWGDGSASSGFFTGTVGVQNLRISAVTNPVGQTVNHVQYGNVFVGSTAASFDVDTDGALGWRLRVTPNSTYVTTIRAQAVLSRNLGGGGS